MDYEPADEASNLLRNGILVETNTGLICMSLNDAIASGLNVSAEALRNVAAELILQQEGTKDEVFVPQVTFNFDSDGFSSECSDISTTTSGSSLPTLITLSTLTSENQSLIISESAIQGIIKRPTVPSADPSNSDQSEIEHVGEKVSLKNETSDVLKTSPEANKPKKGRGGWPKGRKRKPELLNLPPKAPATGYNLYLNEQRKLFKDSSLAFHEITKKIGNKWSSLSLAEKEPYLNKAEEDKKRYREELKQYRQSDAYRAYLTHKRKKRLQNNVLSESDMDATDEIDEEDNEELYCRTCDQWFHNLHNKREHLQGKQHTQSVAGDINKELGSDDKKINSSISTLVDSSNADSSSVKSGEGSSLSVFDAMTNLLAAVSRRETEVAMLNKQQEENMALQQKYCRQLSILNERSNKLKQDLFNLQETGKELENSIFHLWQVPSLFVVTDFNTDSGNDFTDGS